MNKKEKIPGGYRKVMITLTPEHEAFLDKLCNDVVSHQGASLSRTEVIRALIKLMSTLKLDLKGIKNESDLLDRMILAIKKK